VGDTQEWFSRLLLFSIEIAQLVEYLFSSRPSLQISEPFPIISMFWISKIKRHADADNEAG